MTAMAKLTKAVLQNQMRYNAPGASLTLTIAFLLAATPPPRSFMSDQSEKKPRAAKKSVLKIGDIANACFQIWRTQVCEAEIIAGWSCVGTRGFNVATLAMTSLQFQICVRPRSAMRPSYARTSRPKVRAWGMPGARRTRRWSNGPRGLPGKPRSLRRCLGRVARLGWEAGGRPSPWCG